MAGPGKARVARPPAPEARAAAAEPTTGSPATATREQILTTAERLFGEFGLTGVSMREITKEAGVNVAAVNYHFGTKEKLFETVFLRRAQPLAAERMRLLDECWQRSGGKPDLEEVLLAFIVPSFGRTPQERVALAGVSRLRARLAVEPAELSRRLLSKAFDESSRAFLRVLGAALPDLPRADLQWRFHFMLGTTVYTWGNPQRIQALTDGECDPSDIDAVIAELIPFLVAGFRAPPVSG